MEGYYLDVDCEKILGVMIKKKLSWEHIKSVESKVNIVNNVDEK